MADRRLERLTYTEEVTTITANHPPSPSTRGIIFNLQRFSTEDGPGLRTTAFLKGCPLRCAWCHNPEGLSGKPQVVWYDAKCIDCGDCVLACPTGVLTRRETGMHLDRSRCKACGVCARACPASALEVLGRELTAAELAAELARDAEFFRTSGGGVTFSGGECLMQPDFLVAAAREVRAQGIHVAIDTSGFAAPAVFRQALEVADLVLYDLKLIDAERHRALTGTDNKVILDNARTLAASGVPFWVRFPVIPGYTDDEANVAAVSTFVAREMPGAERVDFLAYNNLCRPDYARLDLDFALGDRGLLSKEEMERVLAVARRSGLEPVVGGPLGGS